VAQWRPNFNQPVRALLWHIVQTMPEFSTIRPSRILVVAGEARRASRGTIKPLVFGRKRKRQRTQVRIKRRRMLYCITLRPLFFRGSTPQGRIETILHELFHIAPQFDGSLHPGRRHSKVGKKFGRRFRPLVRRYLRQCPPEIFAPFAYDGEVRVQQWLERPGAPSASGLAKARKVYTEEQLFLGVVRMVTRRTRPAQSSKAAIKVH